MVTYDYYYRHRGFKSGFVTPTFENSFVGVRPSLEGLGMDTNRLLNNNLTNNALNYVIDIAHTEIHFKITVTTITWTLT